MVDITEKRLDDILAGISGKRIAVIGDLMLDRYIWGSVTRISPEAPVPIVDVDSEQTRLGGAANVAKNIQSLGGDPFIIGVIGDDNSGKNLHALLKESEFVKDGIVIDASRPTTVKTRIIAHNQHVVRTDRESRKDISPEIQQKIMAIFRKKIDTIDGIIIEDYNKGVVVKGLIAEILALALSMKKIVSVDPKFHNFFEYKNATIFKPNRKEAEEALGMKLKTDEEVIIAGKEILRRLEADNVLLTRGERGMSLFDSSGGVYHTPTKARNIADVSGAGDTVIATLTLALAAGAAVREAAALANYAGGVVCGYVGIVPIHTAKLREAVLTDGATSSASAKE
ncbi:MAG: D-glycero-beta-D-manno-heptose-7-phosphate kinase [Bacteroidota bacterium]